MTDPLAPLQAAQKEMATMQILCIRGSYRHVACWFCGAPAPFLCDGPRRPDQRSRSRTCDRGLCARHRVWGGEGLDYCHAHDPRSEAAPEVTHQPELLPR